MYVCVRVCECMYLCACVCVCVCKCVCARMGTFPGYAKGPLQYTIPVGACLHSYLSKLPQPLQSIRKAGSNLVAAYYSRGDLRSAIFRNFCNFFRNFPQFFGGYRNFYPWDYLNLQFSEGVRNLRIWFEIHNFARNILFFNQNL